MIIIQTVSITKILFPNHICNPSGHSGCRYAKFLAQVYRVLGAGVFFCRGSAPQNRHTHVLLARVHTLFPHPLQQHSAPAPVTLGTSETPYLHLAEEHSRSSTGRSRNLWANSISSSPSSSAILRNQYGSSDRCLCTVSSKRSQWGRVLAARTIDGLKSEGKAPVKSQMAPPASVRMRLAAA